jgi:hypothetical protein
VIKNHTPAAMPRHLMAPWGVTVAAGENGRVAAIYWARSPVYNVGFLKNKVGPLLVADVVVLTISPDLVQRIVDRATDLHSQCRGRGAPEFVCDDEELAAHLRRGGLPIGLLEEVPTPEEMLRFGSTCITNRLVRISEGLRLSGGNIPIGAILAAGGDDADPVRGAFLLGLHCFLRDSRTGDVFYGAVSEDPVPTVPAASVTPPGRGPAQARPDFRTTPHGRLLQQIAEQQRAGGGRHFRV